MRAGRKLRLDQARRERSSICRETSIRRTRPPTPVTIYGVAPLPANDATVGVGPDGKNYIYPVAEYDHNGAAVTLGQDYTATSVASSFRLHNGSDPTLDNQFIFLNFAFNHGDVYHTDFDAMLGAVTQLNPLDPSRDNPSELTQAQLQRLHLTLDGDNNPNTPPTTSDNINTLARRVPQRLALRRRHFRRDVHLEQEQRRNLSGDQHRAGQPADAHGRPRLRRHDDYQHDRLEHRREWRERVLAVAFARSGWIPKRRRRLDAVSRSTPPLALEPAERCRLVRADRRQFRVSRQCLRCRS